MYDKFFLYLPIILNFDIIFERFIDYVNFIKGLKIRKPLHIILHEYFYVTHTLVQLWLYEPFVLQDFLEFHKPG